MTTRILSLKTGLISGLSFTIAVSMAMAEPFEVGAGLTDNTLKLISVSPSQEEQNTITLEGPADLAVQLAEDKRSLRITAADGALVTVPPAMVRLADVRALVASNGEASTVLNFPVPVTLNIDERPDGARIYEIRGGLAVRRWGQVLGGIDPIAEISNPRTTTVLGDAFRVIATLMDTAAGVLIEEPKLSDEELIRRLSAEVVRLKAEVKSLQDEAALKASAKIIIRGSSNK